MEQGPVGRTGVSIYSIGLGSVMFGELLEEQESFRILDYALEKGITYMDTAEWYGNGMSERIIGNWMHQRRCRDQITVLTKFYPPSATSWGNREYIRKALDASLSRLRTDYVDIYMMHFPDPAAPISKRRYPHYQRRPKPDGSVPSGAAISTSINWKRLGKQAHWADTNASRSTSRSTI